MASYRLGLIGYGKIAETEHLPAIARSGAFHLAAVASRHVPRLDGVDKVVADFHELLADPAIDAVAVCSATRDHYAMAREALLAGKPVLLEKPPATTVGAAQALRDLAEARRVPLFATWHARENPAVDEAARRLAGQEVARLRITWKEDVRRWHPGQTWIWQAGGFGVFDPGVNAFSIATAILPAPIFVTAAMLSRPANQQTPIHASIVFGSGAGAADLSAELDWRHTGEEVWDIEVDTRTGGRVRLSSGGADLSIDGAVVAQPASGEYDRLYRRFAELLGAGRSEVDLRPLQLVADALLCGETVLVESFDP